MQISTSSFYDRSARTMSSLSAQADTISTQINSQTRIQSAVDDPVAYQRLQGLARASANDDAYASNLTLAASVLQQADTTLSAITTQLQQASELAVQANNGTLSDTDRAAIGLQISGIRDTIAGLINTTDARGQPLFGDANGGAAAVKQADGSYALSTTTASAIPIADGQSVLANESATRVLGSGGADILARLSALATALSGTTPGTAASDAITAIKAASDQVSSVQSSMGARASRVDLLQTTMKQTAVDREASRASIDGFDYATSITELQKTMTVLQAAQASFNKLSQLSLFDYLK